MPNCAVKGLPPGCLRQGAAVTGVFSWKPVLLSLAVLLWVAGFDMIYSLQDVGFDRSNGLHSVPVQFGEKMTLKISAFCHVGTVAFLSLFGIIVGLGFIYWVGVAVCSLLLFFEHRLVSEGDLGRINTAFFTINGWIGILLLIFS
ncbi:MAG: UbiA family prenyltransferase, partial [Rhodospirillales bacterium]|nr:UbiA family prenyltransferase [Rhodospirillales bacterium]